MRQSSTPRRQGANEQQKPGAELPSKAARFLEVFTVRALTEYLRSLDGFRYNMKSMGKSKSEAERDALLLKLLHTPPQPRPKRERVMAPANPIVEERKTRPPSKGRVHKGRTRD